VEQVFCGADKKEILVGVRGFEPPASTSRIPSGRLFGPLL